MTDEGMGLNELLVPVFMPTLIDLLQHAEKQKGSPLTREEVIELRDNGVCIMMRLEHAEQLAEKRGYHDIDPQRCWVDWQRVREEIAAPGS